MSVVLRRLHDADLDTLFEWERAPRPVHMAAFTRQAPASRDAFDAHYQRVRNDDSVTLHAVDDGDGLVGMVARHQDGPTASPLMSRTQVLPSTAAIPAPWIDPARWGEGLATAALAQLLALEPIRPLLARVAEHNSASAKVLVRAGFVRVGAETSHANGVGRHIAEHLDQLTS